MWPIYQEQNAQFANQYEEFKSLYNRDRKLPAMSESLSGHRVSLDLIVAVTLVIRKACEDNDKEIQPCASAGAESLSALLGRLRERTDLPEAAQTVSCLDNLRAAVGRKFSRRAGRDTANQLEQLIGIVRRDLASGLDFETWNSRAELSKAMWTTLQTLATTGNVPPADLDIVTGIIAKYEAALSAKQYAAPDILLAQLQVCLGTVASVDSSVNEIKKQMIELEATLEMVVRQSEGSK